MIQNLITKPSELRSINLDNDIILDVRTDAEHEDKHIELKHLHIPLNELKPEEFIKHYNIKSDTVIYLLCRGGKRAEHAARKFVESGHNAVQVIAGGLTACEEYGHRMIKNTCTLGCKEPVSLERQVRIVAGTCCTLGAILALLMNPLFSLIPMFIGAGLVYSGITDNCGLGFILTKARWNKKKL